MSLRVKLITLIFLSTTLAWSVAAYRSFIDVRHEINELFDAHLSESARAILLQAQHEQREASKSDKSEHEDRDERTEQDYEDDAFNIPELLQRGNLFEKRLYFQLRNASGEYLMGSMRDPNAKSFTINTKDGFSEGSYRGESIRVFSAWSLDRSLNIQVAESMNKRNMIVGSSIKNVLMPILFTILPLLFLLAIIVEYALKPIRSLAHEVEHRSPDNLTAIESQTIPKDIRPITLALNNLFSRLSRALANERRFTADAAHELRTPLAGIKVQAQVALQSQSSESMRNHALMGVSKGVDRATHLIEQLLTMARLDPETELDGKKIKLRELVITVASELAPEALRKPLDLGIDEGPELTIYGNAAMLQILLRNLLDNAIRYSPQNGFVRVKVYEKAGRVHLSVENNGPGLTEEQRRTVTERFSRVSRPSGEGSGLGLSIVKRIAELHDASLNFGTGENNEGCRVELIFSAPDKSQRDDL